jgi:hypothetical protein
MTYQHIALDTPARQRLLALALADDGCTPAAVLDDEATTTLHKARYLDTVATDEGDEFLQVRIRDEAFRWALHYLESGYWRLADESPAEHGDWQSLLDRQRTVMEVWTRPMRSTLEPGGPFGHHHLPGHAAELAARSDIERFYEPGLREWRRAQDRPSRDIGTVDDLERIIARAPQPALLGVDDWGRAMRADEEAFMWGDDPPARRPWLERVDEIAAAWGRPLFGPGSWFGHPIDEYL